MKVLDLKSGASVVSLLGTVPADSAPGATAGVFNHGHAKSVICLETHHEGTLLLTGSEDETARLINAKSGKVRLFYMRNSNYAF